MNRNKNRRTYVRTLLIIYLLLSAALSFSVSLSWLKRHFYLHATEVEVLLHTQFAAGPMFSQQIVPAYHLVSLYYCKEKQSEFLKWGPLYIGPIPGSTFPPVHLSNCLCLCQDLLEHMPSYFDNLLLASLSWTGGRKCSGHTHTHTHTR